ncbi:hypothetical protein M7I_2539 [Glarea lozoyensis 74030]|uniref:PAS domain-containing protein n=1 Tax=Glarea lozoyensis (strain ATCC 74030 / MF5533) TaxID=1104152 RepID=H0EJ16_GLAL7|nr:hypothetical protein M7I_2539 [Glarea lozoyensis 74030]
MGANLRKALDAMAPVVVEIAEVDEPLEWRGYGKATHGVICPIIPKGSNSVLAFLCIALNPHRPYDKDYKRFVHHLIHQVTQPQLSSIILREEVENRQNAARQAAIDRERLSRELTASETRFEKFAARVPLGLGILTPEGKSLSANEMWVNITQLQQGDEMDAWSDVIVPSEVPAVLEAWSFMVQEKKPAHFESAAWSLKRKG